MPKLLERLMALISTYKPEKLLILGDVKHTIATAELCARYVKRGFGDQLEISTKGTTSIEKHG
jgi:metallophosphoesterase superfamily enzyme